MSLNQKCFGIEDSTLCISTTRVHELYSNLPVTQRNSSKQWCERDRSGIVHDNDHNGVCRTRNSPFSINRRYQAVYHLLKLMS